MTFLEILWFWWRFASLPVAIISCVLWYKIESGYKKMYFDLVPKYNARSTITAVWRNPTEGDGGNHLDLWVNLHTNQFFIYFNNLKNGKKEWKEFLPKELAEKQMYKVCKEFDGNIQIIGPEQSPHDKQMNEKALKWLKRMSGVPDSLKRRPEDKDNDGTI